MVVNFFTVEGTIGTVMRIECSSLSIYTRTVFITRGPFIKKIKKNKKFKNNRPGRFLDSDKKIIKKVIRPFCPVSSVHYSSAAVSRRGSAGDAAIVLYVLGCPCLSGSKWIEIPSHGYFFIHQLHMPE